MRRFSVGIKLKLPGCDPDRLYFRALLLVSADYPAAGQFCGTMESVSATHFCRHCYVSQPHRTEVVNFMKGDLQFCRLRTHEAHLADICRVCDGAELPSGSGVHSWGTALKDEFIPWARSIEMVPEDIMHDYLAGQLVAEFHIAFRCFARNRKHPNFSRVSLNKAVHDWPFHETPTVTRPAPFKAKAFEGDPEIAKSSRLGLTCAHVMYLALILIPLLTSGDCPLLDLTDEDPVFDSLALHIKVLLLLLKDRFSLREVKHLQMVLLQQHIKLREVHPALAKRHKFHMTLHIPSEILQFGPPRHYWCMRFEAKHQDIKALEGLLNFVNLPQAVCRLSSIVQAIQVHSEKTKRMLSDSFEECDGDLCVAREFHIDAGCADLTSALAGLLPKLKDGDLSAQKSITDLVFVRFSGSQWKPHQHIMFSAEGGWVAARIDAIWFIGAVSELVFKVSYHSKIWTAPNAVGTSVVRMYAEGNGFVLASEPTLRRVFVVPCDSSFHIAWLIEI